MTSITEDQLRLLLICSEAFYRNKDKELYSPLGLIARYAFETQMSEAITGQQREIKDYFDEAAELVGLSNSLTATEIEKLKTKGIVHYSEVMKKLYLSLYTPVIGSLDKHIKLNDLTIDIHYSGIGRTKEGAIRAWVFSPFFKQQDIYSDIVHRLQHEVIKSLYKEIGYIEGQPAKIYVIGSTATELKVVSFETLGRDKMYIKELALVEAIVTNNIHYRTVPCLHKQCMCRG